MAQEVKSQRQNSRKEAGRGLAELDKVYRLGIDIPKSPTTDTDIVLQTVKSCLKNQGVGLDLSNLTLYYDGLADEWHTSHGTPVYRCPVWYGGIDSDPESITLSVYEIDSNRLCLNLMHFRMHEKFQEKELFIKPTSA